MANVGRSDGARIRWGFFGSELKRRRERAGFTQQALGERVFCSGSYIGQIEAGIRRPQLELAKRIDVELETGEYFERVYEELICRSVYDHFFAAAAELEGRAATIREFAPTLVPGLLQTADYARAVFLGGFPFAPGDEIQTWVDARLERAQILDHPTKPVFWAVLDEAVIRRQVGGAAVMRGQLLHIASLVRSRRVGVQVLAFAAGSPALDGVLSLTTFDEEPTVAYTEGSHTGELLDDPATVERCEFSYDLVRSAALSPEASLSLIESVAKEYADASGG
ncbi:Scr1 family TA system antitoxin-like transcriptional regulator [Streptomyces sp. NPDC052396]|uniref:helix-turn-helix domain-containing protein n=1 Tax=Streptomyces sp. NPDC052396 TaxID=3365689 RepID=UPI0037D309A5